MDPKRRILVYGVLFGEEGLLLLERDVSHRKLPWKTVWETPGGKVDRGETPDEAVIREFEEETGIRAKIKVFLGSTRFDDEYQKREALFYLLEGEAKEVKLSDPEHVDWKFFGVEELERLENIALTTIAALKFLDRWGILPLPELPRVCDCELFLPAENSEDYPWLTK